MANDRKASNLVVAVRIAERTVEEDGKKRVVRDSIISAFHTPISREVFDLHWRLIAATKRDLFTGIVSATNTRAMVSAYEDAATIATRALIDAARADAFAHGEEDVPAKPPAAVAFLAELERLTWIIAPSDQGFEQVPPALAVSKGIIDRDEWAKALSGIVLFTVACQMAHNADREWTASLSASVLPGSITSSALPEYVNSLKASTSANASPTAALATP